jgi:hypothetical protein
MDKEYFLKRLGALRPTAFQAYCYELLPSSFLAHDKIPIECHLHGVFYQKAHSHLNGQGCQVCGRLLSDKNRRLTIDDFIINSQARFGNKFSYEKTVYIDRFSELVVTCDVHDDIILTPEQHRWSKHGCPKCDYEIPRAKKKQVVLDKARRIHGDLYDYSRVVFTNTSDKVEIGCSAHGSFWQSLYDHVNKRNRCPHCANAPDTFAEFVSKARKVHGDRYSYCEDSYQTTASIITISCSKHGEFPQRAASHLSGSKCKKCHVEEMRLSAEEFALNAKEIHRDRYDYSRVVYRGNKFKVEIICSKHGSFWQKPNAHVSSKNGCQLCAESHGEKAVEAVLKKYGINHVREYRIKPHLYRFDFYLPEFNIFIEFNGLQHYRPVEIFGGMAAYLSTVERDDVKRQLVKAIGGKLIVLTYLNLSGSSVENALIQQLKRFRVLA